MLRRSHADESGKRQDSPTDNEWVQRVPSGVDAEMSTAVDDVLTAEVMAMRIFGVGSARRRAIRCSTP